MMTMAIFLIRSTTLPIQNTSLHRIFKLFRGLGLSHLMVVNKYNLVSPRVLTVHIDYRMVVWLYERVGMNVVRVLSIFFLYYVFLSMEFLLRISFHNHTNLTTHYSTNIIIFIIHLFH